MKKLRAVVIACLLLPMGCNQDRLPHGKPLAGETRILKQGERAFIFTSPNPTSIPNIRAAYVQIRTTENSSDFVTTLLIGDGETGDEVELIVVELNGTHSFPAMNHPLARKVP